MSRLRLAYSLRVRHRNKRIPSPNDDRFGQIHPASFAHSRRRQQGQPLASARIDLEDRNTPTRLDAIKVETRNAPVFSEAESEPGILVQRDHPAFFLRRIIASFSFLASALIAASRFRAELWSGWAS